MTVENFFSHVMSSCQESVMYVGAYKRTSSNDNNKLNVCLYVMSVDSTERDKDKHRHRDTDNGGWGGGERED